MKGKKQEEIDISTLPSWLPLAVNLNFGTSKERAAKITKNLQNCTYGPMKFITRDDLISYGKEKQLYADSSQANEKARKGAVGASTDVPTLLTPGLLAKIFVQFYHDLSIQGRKVFILILT